MEDYRNKLESLSLERLKSLKERYEETLAQYEKRVREAHTVGLPHVASYHEEEMKKKRIELEEIEKILTLKEGN